MTPDQFANWKDFTFRMVEHAHDQLDEVTRKEARACAESLFDRLDEEDIAAIVDWDHSHASALVTDLVKDVLWDSGHAYDDEVDGVSHTAAGIAALASIRAGIDVAVSPSAGVLGYELNDIRKMYPEGIPAWVTDFLPEGHEALAESTSLWL